MITHDLGVVAEIADEGVVVMYSKVAEEGSVDEIFTRPHHPTRGSCSAPCPGSTRTSSGSCRSGAAAVGS